MPLHLIIMDKNEVCLQDTHDAPHLTIRNNKQVNLNYVHKYHTKY